MKHIKLFESFENDNMVSYNDFIAENTDKSLDYSKYIAEQNISLNGNYMSNMKSSSSPVNMSRTEYLGNSRIDGEPLYKHHMMSSGLTTIEISKGRLDNQWYNDVGQPIPKPFIPDKDMDWWNKENNNPLSKYQLWTIGIGIGSLIVSIVTVVVLFFI